MAPLKRAEPGAGGVIGRRGCLPSFVNMNLDRLVRPCNNGEEYEGRMCDGYAEGKIFQPGFAGGAVCDAGDCAR